jgi:hypothetical protein
MKRGSGHYIKDKNLTINICNETKASFPHFKGAPEVNIFNKTAMTQRRKRLNINVKINQ